jgi:hypothetical protein
MRSEAGQGQVTHDEDEDCPPHRARRSAEVRAGLAVVHAFSSLCSQEPGCFLTTGKGSLWRSSPRSCIPSRIASYFCPKEIVLTMNHQLRTSGMAPIEP